MNAITGVTKRSLARFLTEGIVLNEVANRLLSWEEASPDSGFDCRYAVHPPRKTRLISFHDPLMVSINDPHPQVSQEDTASEPAELDLFELMAQWKDEDSEEDLAYLREFHEELDALRGLSR